MSYVRYNPTPRWADELEQQLRTLWADTMLSAEVIGRRLGMTRCAVLGKAHRLHLPARRQGRITGVSKAPRPKKKRVRVYNPVVNNGPPKAAKKPVKNVERGGNEARTLVSIPVPLMLDLMKIDDTTCRYPIGDGPFLFCGHRTKAGSPYCSYHHALCYVPAEERRAPKIVNYAVKRAA